MNNKSHKISDEDVSQEFLEKVLKDYYCYGDSCKGWETNVITQPQTVKNIVDVGASRIAAGKGVGNSIKDKNIASKIDHTMLKPDATPQEITELCEEAKKYHFASVCINPGYVSLCASLLKGSEVRICTVVGFPLGATTAEVKKFETEQAIKNGATEIDMVINVGRLKAGDNSYVENDVNEVVMTAKSKGALVKVIIEAALLTDEEKVKACLICKSRSRFRKNIHRF
ncbi:MAG: deoxyribose-phosphate aldolase [Ignavibacteriaceae bacterium]|nr:deoxyribose-phosphate aldolase [Ignavibacteriaceae bacterium]